MHVIGGKNGDGEVAAGEGVGGGGSSNGVAEVPFLKWRDTRTKPSSTQNGRPNLMCRCPSLSMRSSLT